MRRLRRRPAKRSNGRRKPLDIARRRVRAFPGDRLAGGHDVLHLDAPRECEHVPVPLEGRLDFAALDEEVAALRDLGVLVVGAHVFERARLGAVKLAENALGKLAAYDRGLARLHERLRRLVEVLRERGRARREPDRFAREVDDRVARKRRADLVDAPLVK